MPTRRRVLAGLAAATATAASAAGYGFLVEPRRDPRVVTYSLSPPGWRSGQRLRIAVLSDWHAGDPGFPIMRVRSVVRATNDLKPDLICLLGDYCGGAGARGRLPPEDMARALADLQAPLGRYAIFGNHDYWDGIQPFRSAFVRARIPILENVRVKLGEGSSAFWLAGLASTLAIPRGNGRYEGLDDLPGTLEHVTDDAPVVLLVHEPDLFPQVPRRVSLTLAGHTHGGQVRLLGWSPVVPSAFGNRYAYGHVVEDGRHLIVSGGLGQSILPIRFGVPPEITVIDLG